MKWLVLFFLLCACGVAYAEHGCQDGFIPVNQGSGQTCVADYNLPYWKNQSNAASAPVGPRWKTTWGAIATDGGNSILGTSVGMYSKRQAEKAALAQCREKGGSQCEVDLAFYNQCAVLVTGDRMFTTQGAASAEEAARIGMERCNKTDVNCHVYYSDCSPAERVR